MGETGKRLVSGFSIGILYASAFNLKLPYNFLLFIAATLFIVMAMHEFYRMTSKNENDKPYHKSGLAFGLLVMLMFYVQSLRITIMRNPNEYPQGLADALSHFSLSFHTIMAVTLFFMLLMFLRKLVSGTNEGTVYSIGTTMLGVLYVPFTASHLFLLHQLEDGIFYLWLVSFSTFMSDTGAYFMGRAFGKHKAGIAASPNKTYEGYFLGFFFQLILTHGFYQLAKTYFDVPDMSILALSAFSLVIYLVSVLGDLIASAIKRDTNVKDSGSLLPGHGGILDLIDALILTIPGAYYFLVLRQFLITL